MDPLSITASIITILHLASRLTTYLNDVKQATAEQKNVAIEVSNLTSLLTHLRYRVEGAHSNDPWFAQIKLLGSTNGPLDQLKAIIDNISRSVSVGRTQKAKASLQWKWTKANVDTALRRVERLKGIINIALNSDAYRLEEAIHSEIQATHRDIQVLYQDAQTIDGGVKQLVNNTAALQFDVEKLKAQADKNFIDHLSRWLQVPDPTSNYQAALDKHQAQTGSWLLTSSQLQDWKTSQSSFMWLHGSPGCGKTILSAIALRNILDDGSRPIDAVVAYFYFDFNNVEKQQSVRALRSLLFQLALQMPQCLTDLEQAYQRCNNGRLPLSNESVHTMLMNALALPNQTYLVLDALDECNDRPDLLPFISTLVSSSQHDVHLLATSRRERDIEEELQSIANHVIDIQSRVVDKDIGIYVDAVLAKDPKFRRFSQPVKDEIREELTNKAHGMFRWVFCQLESLRTCVTRAAIRRALISLPRTLDETYARIIRSLEWGYHFQDAVKVLKWLCYAERPLRLAEVADIIAINQGVFDPDERLTDPADVLTICSSLISYHYVRFEPTEPNDESTADEDEDEATSESSDDSSQVNEDQQNEVVEVRLAHFSVKEYLLSNRSYLQMDLLAEHSHDAIANGCLDYLLCAVKDIPSCEDTLTDYPLVSYGAEFWARHARLAGDQCSTAAIDHMKELLTSTSLTHSWICLHDPDQIWSNAQFWRGPENVAPPLYYAAMTGLSVLVEFLLEQGADISLEGGRHKSALAVAANRGHANIVQILLDHAAKTRYELPALALYEASKAGHEQIVQMLLERRINISAAFFDGTALHVASKKGQTGIVQMLIDNGADVNLRAAIYINDGSGPRLISALEQAAKAGHTKTVQILLEAGSAIEATDADQDSPLAVAARENHVDIVQMLLAHGANVNRIGEVCTASAIAASQGNTQVLQLLLDHDGIDINIDGNTALLWAIERDRTEVAHTLLKSGLVVDIEDFHTPQEGSRLCRLAKQGSKEIIQLLLDRGVEADTKDYHGRTMLYKAAGSGHKEIVQMLLDKGADVDQCASGKTALQKAREKNQTEVVQLLTTHMATTITPTAATVM